MTQAVAIVLGLSATGLYAIRELGRAGIRAMGLAAERQTAAGSRFLTATPPLIIEADEARRLERLIAFASSEKEKPVLIATSDQDIDFITRHRQPLAPICRIQASHLDGMAIRLMDKARFYEACQAAGIAAPSHVDALASTLVESARDLTFPCLIKPSRIHAVKRFMAGRKVFLLEDRAALARLAPQLPNETSWIVQEIIPGPESEIHLYAAFFDCANTPRQSFTCRKLRQYPPGFGSASKVRSETLDEVRQLSERLLRSLGYKGIVATEFKRDPRDGRLKAIEMNPRPSLWFAASTAAGKQMTLAAYSELTGAPPPVEIEQKNGVEWRYGGKDQYSAAFYRSKRGFVLPAPDTTRGPPRTTRVSAVFSWDDPNPVFEDMRAMARKLVRRAGTGGRR